MSKVGGSRKATPPPSTTNNNISDSGDEEESCPLCLEGMDDSDCRFHPCPCGYQICRFCWHRIREEGNERCPACRRIYTDEDIVFSPAPEGSEEPKKNKKTLSISTSSSNANLTANYANVPPGVLASRRHLHDLRVIQKNLVYVIGISARIASESMLKEPEYFGQFGKILKIVVNRRNTGTLISTSFAGGDKGLAGAATTTSGSAYITFSRAEEASRAIACVDGSVFDGRILRATYGTTKYCSYFLRGTSCPNPGCMYLHEEGGDSDSFTKEELSSGKMQLHSHIVDKLEGNNLRQFGILMRPAATAIQRNPTPIATVNMATTTVIMNNTSVSPPPPVMSPLPTSPPPINLAEYEGEAMSFLTRLGKWNQSSQFDSVDSLVNNTNKGDAAVSSSSSTSSLSSSSIIIEDSQVAFDPFADHSVVRKRTLPWLDNQQVQQQQGTHEEMELFQTAPMISKGPFLGFDWSARQPLSRPWQEEREPIVTFKKNINGNTVRPAPVGSPADMSAAPGFTHPITSTANTNASTSRSANLDNIFGFYSQNDPIVSSNVVGNGNVKRGLDATSLERQLFFQEPIVKEDNGKIASPQPTNTSRVTFSHIASTNGIATSNAVNGVKSPPPLKSTPIVYATKNATNTPVSTTPLVTSTRKTPAPAPVLPPVKETIKVPIVEVPTKKSPPLNTITSISVTSTPKKAPITVTSTTINTTATNTPISTAPIQKSNLFSVLDEGGSIISIEDSNDEVLHVDPVVKSVVGGKKSKNAAATTTSTVNMVKIPARRAMPILSMQPEYKIVWPSSGNGYASPRPPLFSLLKSNNTNDDGSDERRAWRSWLEDDSRITKIEESHLKQRLLKAQQAMNQWISSLS